MKLLEPTLADPVVARPQASVTEPQHLFLDKGYDFPVIRDLTEAFGYI